ncbi:MAG: methylenetetrahydrofolate reductase [Acidimicrobiales bacterium]
MADESKSTPFEVICEVEPATRPDLMGVRHQIATMSGVATAFLVPDNHIGRATVSSIAVADEIAKMGGRAIACLNARDRNVLGFRRDLLTAAAYGVDEFLFVYGDRPESGSRSDDLTVRAMMAEARRFADEVGQSFRIGLSSALRPIPAWKRDADFLCAQVSFDLDRLLDWRASVEVDCPVHAGVMVVASAAMGRKLSADIPQLAVPTEIIERLEDDPDSGVDLALEQVDAIRASGAFDGVHLIPVSRYREITDRLERR